MIDFYIYHIGMCIVDYRIISRFAEVSWKYHMHSFESWRENSISDSFQSQTLFFCVISVPLCCSLCLMLYGFLFDGWFFFRPLILRCVLDGGLYRSVVRLIVVRCHGHCGAAGNSRNIRFDEGFFLRGLTQ